MKEGDSKVDGKFSLEHLSHNHKDQHVEWHVTDSGKDGSQMKDVQFLLMMKMSDETEDYLAPNPPIDLHLEK
jgi:hypothetical protein